MVKLMTYQSKDKMLMKLIKEHEWLQDQSMSSSFPMHGGWLDCQCYLSKAIQNLNLYKPVDV